MTLEAFSKEKNVRIASRIKWNGKDFRGEQSTPSVVAFMRKHPTVYRWLRSRPRGSIERGCISLRLLCGAANITPEQFLKLDKKAARNLLWDYLDTFRMQHSGKALVSKNWVSSYYLYHNEEKLIWIKGKHDILYEPQKIKMRMTKEVCWRIIHKTKHLRDEAILTLAFESGLRANAVMHLTYGHYKRFEWFYNKTIAVFRVAAKQGTDFTHDNKLRGKGINWYYACLHKEATKVLKQYVAQYHENSTDETPLFYYVRPIDKTKGLHSQTIAAIVKDCVKRAGLDTKKISLHGLRRGFRSVVRNTPTITDVEFKEAIMGHKLKGAQENYFDKNPKEFAREYLKCDFSPPTEVSLELQKKVEDLEQQVAEMKAMQPSTEEWFSQYEKDVNGDSRGRTQPIKITPGPPPKQVSKPEIIIKQPIPQAQHGYFTCQNDFKAYEIEKLPCINDVNYQCAKTICHKQVLDLIGLH